MALYLAFHGITPKVRGGGAGLERILMAFIFYYAGHLYSTYLEKFDAFSFNKLCTLAAFNGCIIAFVTPKITMNMHQMAIPHHKVLLPLVVAVSGIWFYLQISELLKDKVKENELISYIGRHTWDIMIHHQFFFWLFNTFLLMVKRLGLLNLNTFDYDKYMHNIYFRITAYRPVSDMLYLFVGIAGPLICCWLWERYWKEKFQAYRDRLISRVMIAARGK